MINRWIRAAGPLMALSMAAPLYACTLPDAVPEDFAAIESIDGLEGASPSVVLAPLHAGFPESAEGRPSLTLTVAEPVDGRFQVDLVMRGLLDDSVEGEHYRAFVVQDAETGLWRVEALAKRWTCRRGDDDGWTTQPCP